MNNKKFIQYPLILLIVGAFCAGTISLTYSYTTPILEKRLKNEVKEDLNKLYDNTKDFKVLYEDNELAAEDLTSVYEVTLKDGTTRVVYQTTNVGKNGDVISLIAFNKDKLEVVKNIKHMETPGVGAKIDDESYLKKITEQDIKSMNVDTISGATYSSTALKTSVEDATAHYIKEVLK